ncbi:hypothetical protein ACFX19_031561 [Malus domestica]|uniref:Uncharacterized protein n=1 Tax=Malus domestica TaxID=3750 RepID=A0A498K651_MALDO|nr:hypothetical protein DVH24_002946 [Malus domestica]
MNFYLIFLLILLVSLSHDLFAHSSLATRKVQDEDTKTKVARESSNDFRVKALPDLFHVNHQQLYYSSSVEGNHHHVKRKALQLYYSSSVEGNHHHVKRKALHEVHSGANPVSNSINSSAIEEVPSNRMTLIFFIIYVSFFAY